MSLSEDRPRRLLGRLAARENRLNISENFENPSQREEERRPIWGFFSSLLEINLYDLSISLLSDRGIWETTIAAEPAWSKAELYEHLQGVLDPQDHLIPAIAVRLMEQDHDVLFLSGVGEVFPFIRSHNVLNNLQSTATEKPTVLFFPGTYTHGLATGASLDLFGILHDDKYYRAFNILHYEV